MILLAESGSTKTDWCLIGEERVFFETKGMNPLFVDANFIKQELNGIEAIKDRGSVNQVVFYGAGVATEELKKEMLQNLAEVFNNADIEVYSDIETCARAVYEGQPVVACILGTGSNACLYDGDELVQNTPSLGYILGDEGAGSWFGKQLLRDYLYGNTPPGISRRLQTAGITKEEVIKRIYRSERPNQYLASFFHVIAQNKSDDYCQELIKRGLNEFIERHVLVYQTVSDVAFVGGVANAVSDELRSLCSEKGLNCKKIIERPLEALIQRY